MNANYLLLSLFCICLGIPSLIISQDLIPQALEAPSIPSLMQQVGEDAPLFADAVTMRQWIPTITPLNNDTYSTEVAWQVRDGYGLALLLDYQYLVQLGVERIEMGSSAQTLFPVPLEQLDEPYLFTKFIEGQHIHLKVITDQRPDPTTNFIYKIYRAYKAHQMPLAQPNHSRSFGFGGSHAACHTNINCPTAVRAQSVQSGVNRIMMILQQGIGYCTGCLMNNTAEDGKPYILTAYHCIDGYTPIYSAWEFAFEYEHPTCANSSTEPTALVMQGCDYRAGLRESDFALFELDNTLPASAPIQYNGWSRTGTYTDTTFMVHHPAGDVKKYADDDDAPTIYNQSVQWTPTNLSPATSHIRMVLDEGFFEPGSSGAPIFDKQGLVIAQNHGGHFDTLTCETNYMLAGRLSWEWAFGAQTNNHLATYLDPLGQGVQSLAPLSNTDIIREVTLAGNIQKGNGQPLTQVTVTLSGSLAANTLTDANGDYTFQNVPAQGQYTITPTRIDNLDAYGVTATDLYILVQYLKGASAITDPLQLVAGNVNGTSVITASDLKQMVDVLKGVRNNFTGGTYQFFREGYNFPPYGSSFPGSSGSSIIVDNPSTDQLQLNFKAAKLGDLNNSAPAGY